MTNLVKVQRHFKKSLEQLPDSVQWVVVDEVQKVPQLLDTVHQFIERKKLNFALTGSSARKLKKGQANLLAGRAFLRSLWSLTCFELEQKFSLPSVLQWGSLPKLFEIQDEEGKKDYLRTYVHTYLSEEVVAEQLVRNLAPFRKFISVAGQMNGKIINASKIARDVGADYQTVLNYFDILQDTLIGFYLPAYSSSVRKRIRQKPKFFVFDVGVARAMSRQLDIPLRPSTSYYGDVFEHFVISEIYKLTSYFKPDWDLFYLQTKDEAEIDVIIDRPGEVPLLVEIKSTDNVSNLDLSAYLRLVDDFGKCESLLLSNDALPQKIGKTVALPWQEGLRSIFSL